MNATATMNRCGLVQTVARASSLTAAAFDEATLVLWLKAGASWAIVEFLRRHGPRMLYVARRYLHDVDDAEQAVLDATLKMVGTADAPGALATHFDGRCLLSTYAHRAVVNACLMTIRARNAASRGGTGQRRDWPTKYKRGGRDVPLTFVSVERDGRPAHGGAEGPWEISEDRRTGNGSAKGHVQPEPATFDRAMRGMSRENATVVRMRLADRTQKEIAAYLGVSLATVKGRLHNGIVQARAALRAHERGGQR